MRTIVVLATAVALTALAACPAAAQSSGCEIQVGRNATRGGAVGRMTVASGRSCGAPLYRRPEAHEATTSLTLATPPMHGAVVITQPNRFDYTPVAGFTGNDSFVITGLPEPFRVTVTATVTPR